MESVSLSHAISGMLQRPIPQNPFFNNINNTSTRLRSQILPIRSKQFHFQDFHGYTKPSRLLKAEEVKISKDHSDEKVILSSLDSDIYRALYKVELGTSRVSGSSLSDANSGVLLCLIDEHGDSILQRIASSSNNDSLRFQRGSLDQFEFVGPKLERVKAMWVGLESGQWRLDKLSLTVIFRSQSQLSLEEKSESEKVEYISVKYDFEADDIQLGEGRENTSMVELRPRRVTELSGVESTPSLESQQQVVSKEETMREYSNLKFSLLLYDAVIVLAGTSVVYFSSGENEALSFLIGGTGGFLYLLLLQRSVDGVSSDQNMGTVDEVFGGFKVPIYSVLLAIGLGFLIAIKYGSGDSGVWFTAKGLVFGMMGFLACKVSVVLSAFKVVPKRF